MTRIKFIVPPPTMLSGNDICGKKTMAELKKYGFDAETIDYWPDNKAKTFFDRKIPFIVEFRIFKWFSLENYLFSKVLPEIQRSDFVWMSSNMALMNRFSEFEKKLKEKGCKIFMQTMDDWSSVPGGYNIINNRLKHLDALIVSTPNLKNRYTNVFPEIPIHYLEEPIDFSRFEFDSIYSEEFPVIVWTGSAPNLQNCIEKLFYIVEEVNKTVKVKLRIISGREQPIFPSSNFITDWRPFSHEKENVNFEGCSIGLSFLNFDVYDECKGNYKVKSYLAKGFPVVGSDWGYNKELIINNRNGYLVKTDYEFIEKILWILKDRTKLDSKDLIRSNAYRRFSHQAVIPSWVSFFNNFV